jgi:hypothetical protein
VGRSRTGPLSLLRIPVRFAFTTDSSERSRHHGKVIPKQPKKERDQITIRLDREVLETLEHYCRYLESRRDWVINQCLTFVFRKDKEFSRWLAYQGIASSPAIGDGAGEEPPPISANRKDKPRAVQGRLPIAE